MSKLIDLTGRRFGRLTVIKRVENDKWGKSRWLCRCSCEDENETIVLDRCLKNSQTRSCGCLQKEIATKHGHNRVNETTEFYKSWANMIQRCTNPKNKQWKDYGGRGIMVCKRWMKFENFLEDMGKDWKSGLTIERIKNNKGYYKENCKWATREQQQRNRRNNRLIPCFGKTQCLAAWAEEYNIPYGTLLARINRLGWSIKKALITPVRKYRERRK